MTITGKIRELRERTGLGMLDCKQALLNASGDMDEAIDILRKASGVKAVKKSGRTAANGVVRLHQNERRGFLLEVNCETDFAAGNTDFIAFADRALEALINQGNDDIECLSNTMAEEREAIIQKIGENVQLRRAAVLDASTTLGAYLHQNRIAVLVGMTGGDEALGRDIAMHIAASVPLVINREEIPEEEIAKEREIYLAQSQQTGKPEHVIEKMVEGRVNKYLAESSLVEQPFVKDPKRKVGDLLKDAGASVEEFIHFKVGEGIEVEETNFADEVAAQLRDRK